MNKGFSNGDTVKRFAGIPTRRWTKRQLYMLSHSPGLPITPSTSLLPSHLSKLQWSPFLATRTNWTGNLPLLVVWLSPFHNSQWVSSPVSGHGHWRLRDWYSRRGLDPSWCLALMLISLRIHTTGPVLLIHKASHANCSNFYILS